MATEQGHAGPTKPLQLAMIPSNSPDMPLSLHSFEAKPAPADWKRQRKTRPKAVSAAPAPKMLKAVGKKSQSEPCITFAKEEVLLRAKNRGSALTSQIKEHSEFISQRNQYLSERSPRRGVPRAASAMIMDSGARGSGQTGNTKRASNGRHDSQVSQAGQPAFVVQNHPGGVSIVMPPTPRRRPPLTCIVFFPNVATSHSEAGFKYVRMRVPPAMTTGHLMEEAKRQYVRHWREEAMKREASAAQTRRSRSQDVELLRVGRSGTATEVDAAFPGKSYICEAEVEDEEEEKKLLAWKQTWDDMPPESKPPELLPLSVAGIDHDNPAFDPTTRLEHTGVWSFAVKARNTVPLSPSAHSNSSPRGQAPTPPASTSWTAWLALCCRCACCNKASKLKQQPPLGCAQGTYSP